MDRLGEIPIPTLVLAGRDDFVFPPESQALLAAGIPNARLRIIERAGHNPQYERPAEIMAAIRDFMAAPRLPGRRRAGLIRRSRCAFSIAGGGGLIGSAVAGSWHPVVTRSSGSCVTRPGLGRSMGPRRRDDRRDGLDGFARHRRRYDAVAGPLDLGRQARIHDNRVGSYRLLAEALAGRTRKPECPRLRLGHGHLPVVG